jgi:hypothetical protein
LERDWLLVQRVCVQRDYLFHTSPVSAARFHKFREACIPFGETRRDWDITLYN